MASVNRQKSIAATKRNLNTFLTNNPYQTLSLWINSLLFQSRGMMNRLF